MLELQKSVCILKSLPAGIAPAPPGELWAVATREVVDEDGDIVRVAGIDLSAHRPQSPIKVLAQHLRGLPDGSPPVLGRVEEFRRTMIDGAPALIFRMSWAVDLDGKVTPLASKYKDLYDGGYLDSFSIGASVLEAKPIKGKGSDYVRSKLREISCVTLPANSDAIVLRAIHSRLGDCIDGRCATDSLLQSLDRLQKAMEKRIQPATGSCGCNKGKSDLEARVAALERQFQTVRDDIESSVVAALSGESFTKSRHAGAADEGDDDDDDDLDDDDVAQQVSRSAVAQLKELARSL